MGYEVRQMSFGEILDMGFTLLRDHFVLLAGIASIFYVPLNLAVDAIAGTTGAAPGPEQLGFLIVVVVLAVAIINPIVLAAITFAVGETYLGRPVTIGDALRLGASILLPLVGTSILAVLAEFVGFLLLVIPGLYLVLAFMVLQQVMVLERRFGFDALARSHELMKGHKLRALGIYLVTSVITSVATVGVSIGAAFLPWLGSVLEGFAQGVAYAFLSSVVVVLYFDIRCRKEAFDLEHLARLVEADAEPRLPEPIG